MMVLTTAHGEPITLLDEPPLQGGESAVYQGRDAAGRHLAVKVALLPMPDGAWLDEERLRLEDVASDAHAGAHVVRVRHHGRWGDRPFFALDWCADTLASLVPRAPAARRRELAVSLCRAVDALHAARPGLVHRDIKPTNVLIDGGAIRLADFGTARDQAPGRTRTTEPSHTPGWSPAEQTLPLRHRPDRSWDVYALAATVYFTLVGSAAEAPGRNARQLTPDGHRLLAGAVPEPTGPPSRWLDFGAMSPLTATDLARLRAAGATAAVERALLDALAPRPEARRGSAASLAEALEAPDAVRPGPGALALAVALTAAVAWAAWATSGRSDPPPAATATASIPAGDGVAAFELGVVEVSQRDWRAATGEDPGQHRQRSSGSVGPRCSAYEGVPLLGDELPVVCVSFYDALRYANALSEAQGLPPAYALRDAAGHGHPEVTWDRSSPGWRLPTSAEWAHAAAAGGALPRGEGAAACGLGNVGDLSVAARFARFPDFHPFACNDGTPGLAAVGSFPANRWGLHDLFGNVAEWVWVEPSDAGHRAHRGVTWTDTREAVELGRQGGYLADDRNVTIGLRVARNAR